MHINPKIKTYAGQPARISQVTKGGGRKLYALKTCGGTVATAFDTSGPLQEYASKKLLSLGRHQKRDLERFAAKIAAWAKDGQQWAARGDREMAKVHQRDVRDQIPVRLYNAINR